MVQALPLLLTVTSGLLKAKEQRAFGRIREGQATIDAAAEGDAARNREIKRKRDLLRAISSQIAAAGAHGVAFTEGSPARIAQLDIDEATDDLLIDRANALQRQRGLKAQGRAARKTGDVAGKVTLLDTAVKVGGLI